MIPIGNGAPGMTVSVVIPTYNYGHFVARSAQSAYNQDDVAFSEIIVVDDGSTDDTEAVVSRLKAIRYVRQENAGVSAARNLGVALAGGDYVQFLDADDWLASTKLSDCIASLDDSRTIPFTQMSNVYEARRTAIRRRGYRAARRLLGEPQLWNTRRPLESLLLHEVGVMSPLYPRQALNEVGGFDTSLRVLEDIEINFRLALAGYRFKPLYKVGAYCRNHVSPGRGRTNPLKYEYEYEALKKMLAAAQDVEGAFTASLRVVFAYRFARLSTKPSSIASDALHLAHDLDPSPQYSQMPLVNWYLQTVNQHG